MNWFTNLFKKSDWRLVKEIQSKYTSFKVDPLNPKERIGERNQEMTYYLYEDQNGNRKFDVVDSVSGDINILSSEAKRGWTFRSEDYRHTIRPWLDGRFDPEIPTYESIPRRNFKTALEG